MYLTRTDEGLPGSARAPEYAVDHLVLVMTSAKTRSTAKLLMEPLPSCVMT